MAVVEEINSRCWQVSEHKRTGLKRLARIAAERETLLRSNGRDVLNSDGFRRTRSSPGYLGDVHLDGAGQVNAILGQVGPLQLRCRLCGHQPKGLTVANLVAGARSALARGRRAIFV